MDESHDTDKRPKLSRVRIVYLPPASVASIHCIGGSPEHDTAAELRKFLLQTKLAEIKPDLRQYGFNHPDGKNPDGSDHGYERWVTIPDTMQVSEPFVKKAFTGGLYAAHMIPLGAFEEWHWLCEWAEDNEKYEPNWGDPECMSGLLEEHLNYINMYQMGNQELDKCMQLDLLIPIRPKAA
jgi:integron-associated effector binding protein